MKRCLKCREKDSNRAKRPDVREKKYAATRRTRALPALIFLPRVVRIYTPALF